MKKLSSIDCFNHIRDEVEGQAQVVFQFGRETKPHFARRVG
jgi:hypothetical protein